MATKLRGGQLQDATVTPTQLASTAVTPGEYGDASNVPVITVDADGRITAASEVAVSGGGGISDGDKGDITVSGTGAVWTVDNNVVTNAKAADMATDTIKGRATASTGDPEDLTALPFAFTGDVTRPADSNAQTIANDAVTYAKMQNISAASKLLGRGSAGGAGDTEEITIGSGLTMTATTLSADGGGGGAPTDAEYLVSAANGSLSAEVVIPGLAGDANRAGVGGGGSSVEFDSSDLSAFTWNPGAPAVADADTTIPSHLYIKDTTTTDRMFTKAFTPAGAFDVRCKVSAGADHTPADNWEVGLLLSNSDDSKRLILEIETLSYSPGLPFLAIGLSYSGSYAQVGNAISWASNVAYLRITGDGAGNYSMFLSGDGLTWLFMGTFAFTITVTKLGVRGRSGSATSHYAAFDWLRTDV